MFIAPIQRIQTIEETQNAAPASASGALPFAGVLKDAVQNLEEAKAASSADSYQLSLGNIDDLSQMMINSQKQAIALETTVQLTTRVVNAYKEIMQMQV